MRLDLIPIHKFIAVNNLKEVTDPVLFERGNQPTEEGLLSTEIFGSVLKERSQTFAYVELGGYFFHPYIYKMLKRMDRNIEHAVKGTRKFSITEKGDLVEDEEKGKTGIEFLYKNWNKIKFKRNDSNIRNERIDILEGLGRDVIFTRQWIIIPAFYRDVNLQNMDQGKVSHHEINDLYSRLIRLSMVLQDKSSSFDFVLTNTRSMIQDTLVEIFDIPKETLHKKNGLIRKHLLGKSIDYGSRSVITAPVFRTERYDDMEVDFYHAGIPMGQLAALFTPFVKYWLKNFFLNELSASQNKYPIYDKDGKLKQYVRLADIGTHFNEEYITQAIDRFVHAPSDRFDTIEIPIHKDEDFKGKILMTFTGRSMKTEEDQNPEDSSPLMSRPATWTDIMYQCLSDVLQDKMVWITRYPLLDYFGTFPNKPTILSTIKTTPMWIGENYFPNYPLVDLTIPKDELSVYFIDTVRMSNLYLPGLGGDFDGDQVTVKGVFSQEANAEAMRIMTSKAHILNIYGENMRRTINEGIQTIYTLTKFDD